MKPKTGAPTPTVMPVDHADWSAQLHLSNFVNAYYQYRDLQSLPDCRTILVVGPGQRLVTTVLASRGFSVTTLDVDSRFAPDVVGSVHDMRAFADAQFDAVIASHVLEHLAEPYLDRSLEELARVGRYALIYLPVAGRHAQLRWIPGVRAIDVSLILDIFPYWVRPDGVTPCFAEGQHFWEVGFRGFRRRALRRRFERVFHIMKEYRNRDWTPSVNWVLRSKAAPPESTSVPRGSA